MSLLCFLVEPLLSHRNARTDENVEAMESTARASSFGGSMEVGTSPDKSRQMRAVPE